MDPKDSKKAAGPAAAEAATKASAQAAAEFVVALYPYEKQHADEISFEQGDRIKVLDKHQTGWWTGELKGADGKVRKGNFPSNFVREDEEEEAQSTDIEKQAQATAEEDVVETAPRKGSGFSAPDNTYDENTLIAAFTSSYRDRRFRMALRFLQLASVCVSFGLAADQDSYQEYSEFRALVGIGVFVFLYIILTIVAYLLNLEAKWSSFYCIKQNPQHLLETIMDLIFAIMLLAALIAALDRARSLKNTVKAKVSGVFAFLTFILLIGSGITNWGLYKEPKKRSGAIELV
mmetsp:Transcript_27964/g.49326  ORF Transcript_27964/g.49326 Transcript_27964/m.49326 type:complete len:290 (+) Transcript_27964:148-1017(+)